MNTMSVVICAIVLYFVGLILKKLKFVKDNLIPVILTVLGCLGFLVYQLIIGQVDVNVIINNGVAAAASSVYIHQTSKQLIELLPFNKETKDILEDLIDKYVPEDEKKDE